MAAAWKKKIFNNHFQWKRALVEPGASSAAGQKHVLHTYTPHAHKYRVISLLRNIR